MKIRPHNIAQIGALLALTSLACGLLHHQVFAILHVISHALCFTCMAIVFYSIVFAVGMVTNFFILFCCVLFFIALLFITGFALDWNKQSHFD